MHGELEYVHVSIEQTHPTVVESGNPNESTNPPWNGVSCLESIKMNRIRVSIIPWILSVDLSRTRPLTRNVCT